MTESTVEQYAASTNGRVQSEPPADDDEVARSRGARLASLAIPIVLIVTAVVVLRRMQRGNYA